MIINETKMTISNASVIALGKSRIMPVQKPNQSRQNYGTPWEFINAVEKRFGEITFDLAAEEGNAKHKNYWTESDDSLSKEWAIEHPKGNLWINPPFKNIGTWAEKCATESQKRQGMILFLTPASIGTRYFAEFIHNKAMVLALSPRLVFEGETAAFPKDLMLSVFGCGMRGFDVWRWK